MGLDFRKSLIEELERRRREIDGLLMLLYRVQQGGGLKHESLIQSVFRFEPSLRPASPRRRGGALYTEIHRLRQEGLSLRAIAEHVNLSHAGVWKVLRRSKKSESANSC